MGTFRQDSADSVVKSANSAPASRNFTNKFSHRSLGTVGLLVIAAFSFGQVVTDGTPALAARTTPHNTEAAITTTQRAAALRLVQKPDRAEVSEVATSLRAGALSVVSTDSSAKARARARARELARARATAKEHAFAKSRKAALAKRTSTEKNASKSGPPAAALAIALSANVTPDPNFLATCTTPSSSYFCLGEEVEAIDNARALEGLGPMPLNLTAFSQLNSSEQIFVLTNLERTSRGLAPAVVLTSQLDATATKAASSNTDPTLGGWTLTGGKQAVAWNSNWSGGMSAAESDFYWLYSDGAGFNVDCTSSVTSGCWEHRANVLASPAESCPGTTTPRFVMGAAAAATASYHPSEAEILVQVCGGLPNDSVFSWPQAEKLLGIPVG